MSTFLHARHRILSLEHTFTGFWTFFCHLRKFLKKSRHWLRRALIKNETKASQVTLWFDTVRMKNDAEVRERLSYMTGFLSYASYAYTSFHCCNCLCTNLNPWWSSAIYIWIFQMFEAMFLEYEKSCEDNKQVSSSAHANDSGFLALYACTILHLCNCLCTKIT